MCPIDLDHNATSPLDPDAFEAMRPFWFAGGNPESRHAAGRAARRAVTRATEAVAHVLNAHPEEVVFTSGGTEANNLAIFGLAEGAGPGIACPFEHPAVAEAVAKINTAARPPEGEAGIPLVNSEGLASDGPDEETGDERRHRQLVRGALGGGTACPRFLANAVMPRCRLAKVACGVYHLRSIWKRHEKHGNLGRNRGAAEARHSFGLFEQRDLSARADQQRVGCAR